MKRRSFMQTVAAAILSPFSGLSAAPEPISEVLPPIQCGKGFTLRDCVCGEEIVIKPYFIEHQSL